MKLHFLAQELVLVHRIFFLDMLELFTCNPFIALIYLKKYAKTSLNFFLKSRENLHVNCLTFVTSCFLSRRICSFKIVSVCQPLFYMYMYTLFFKFLEKTNHQCKSGNCKEGKTLFFLNFVIYPIY